MDQHQTLNVVPCASRGSNGTSGSPDEVHGPRVGYVLKVYPRFSQTFVVNEILAHQDVQRPVSLFSLRRPNDPRFHASIARVRSPVSYLDVDGQDADTVGVASFWSRIHQGAQRLPGLWSALRDATAEDPTDVARSIRLACEVTECGVEHLHAHFGNSAATVARLAAKMAGVSYSFTAHARDIFHKTVKADDLRRKLGDAAFVVTVSQFNLDFLKSNFPGSTARTECIYNGLDLDRFSFLESQERAPLILGVGRLVEKKGFADLIDACALLARRGRDFRCEIIGGGPLEIDLRRRVAALGIADRVKFSGALPSEDVIERIRQASVLAAPCVVAADGDRDGLPTVLLEAMALGTVCVSTDVTGIPEAVRDGETGLVVSQHHVEHLADACDRLLMDRQLRHRLARSARRHIELNFCVRRSSARLRHLFCRAVSAPSPDGAAAALGEPPLTQDR